MMIHQCQVTCISKSVVCNMLYVAACTYSSMFVPNIFLLLHKTGHILKFSFAHQASSNCKIPLKKGLKRYFVFASHIVFNS